MGTVALPGVHAAGSVAARGPRGGGKKPQPKLQFELRVLLRLGVLTTELRLSYETESE